MLYSFDIFDTIIIRKVRSPRGIFALTKDKLIKEHLNDVPFSVINNYFQLRIWAEEQARASLINRVYQEVTFDEIYDVFGQMTQVSEKQLKLIKNVEIENEINNVLPIDEVVIYIESLINKGEDIIFISDMYLDKSVISKLINRVAPQLSSIPVYVSSEYKKAKKTGDLYKYIQEEKGIAYDEWIHYGDNIQSDINVPKSLGMNANVINKHTSSKWTQIILEEQKDNVGSQLLLGASNMVLNDGVAFDDIKDKENYSYQVGAEVCGTFFYPYVLWVINQALSKGMTRLFFIARDGYLLKIIADKIIDYRKLPIKTEYLYGSRKAWRLVSLNKDDFDISTFIKWNYPRLITSYKKISEILELEIEELQQFIPYPIDEKTKISDDIKQEVFDILMKEQTNIAEYIVNKQISKKDRVENYLKQELGVMKNEHCGFVELIGSGTTQRCLKNLISKWNDADIETFFYRLDDHKKYDGNINYSFFSNRLPFGNIIEVMTNAPHGQTIDYTFKKDAWEPVFGHDEGEYLLDYGFNDYEKGLKDFLNSAVKIDAMYDDNLMDYHLPTRFFSILNGYEDEKLYAYLADMPYGIRGIDGEVTSFAPKLTDKDIENIFYLRREEPILDIYQGYMLEYSIKRMSEDQKELVEYYKNLEKTTNSNSECRVHKNKDDLIGENLILYGAGKRGKAVYERLTSGKDSLGRNYNKNIIAWADKNDVLVEEYNGPMIKPERINDYEYDQVVVAVAKKEMADEIMDELVQLGIKRSRMIWIR